jgi:hypothetical protein
MPTLTLNFGLRWDFYSAEKDLTGLYHSASPSAIYGPSGVGNLFNPGSVPGDPDPAITTRPSPYNPWKVTPQPAFGFAWNPHLSDGPLMAIFGKDSTVVRGGFALRRFTEPYQYFVDYATDFFSFYYQNFFPESEQLRADWNVCPRKPVGRWYDSGVWTFTDKLPDERA